MRRGRESMRATALLHLSIYSACQLLGLLAMIRVSQSFSPQLRFDPSLRKSSSRPAGGRDGGHCALSLSMTDRNRPRFDRLLGRIHRPLPWRLIRAKPPPSAVIRGDDESINRSSDNTPGVVRATSTTAGIPASAEFKSEGGPLNGGTESSNNGAVNGRRDVSEMGFDMSIWSSLRNFWRHAGETFRASREKPPVRKGDWRYMGTLVMSQRWLVLASMVTLILAAGCAVAVPHYSSRALNAAAFAQDKAEFARSLRGMICFNLLASVFTGLRGALFWLAGTHVVAKVRFDLLASLLNQEIAFHDASETGALTSRLASDTAKISNVVSFHVNILFRQVIQALGGLAYLFYLNRQLASVALTGLVFVGGVTTAYGRFSRRISAKVQSALADAGSVAEQSLSLVRVVRAHANEAHERRRYGVKIGESVQLQETQGIAYGLARVIIGWSQALLLGCVLILGANRVFTGQLSGPALTTFVFYTNFVTDASFDVGDQWAKIQEALGAGQKVFELLDREPKVSTKQQRPQHHPASPSATPPSPVESEVATDSIQVDFGGNQGALVTASVGKEPDIRKAGDISGVSPFLQATPSGSSVGGAGVGQERGSVEFCSVCFGYPTRPGVPVLDDLSLFVQPGEKVAVVGSSGGGKSTILRLLCRFYEPDAGTICLGGRDLSTYDGNEISKSISWVTQEPQLFPISVRENIAYGFADGAYTMADVENAAMAANIHSFVIGLPEGYETLVGEGGASLSGGQKQRVAIARALIRDPEVLLLDEPTSALDTESERLVQEALDRAAEGRSVILIAHRLATIQRADRVLVMQNGRVVESGKHEELMSLGGVYAGLYKQGEKAAML